MPRLYVLESQETLGEITEEQLRFLQEHLEEEHSEDRDYYINRETLEMLKEDGCDETLIRLLERALGDAEDVDVAWE